MLVSCNQMHWHKRIVVLKNNIGFIAFTHESKSMEDLDKCENTISWKFAKEIEEPLKPIHDEGNDRIRRLKSRIFHATADDVLLTI